MIHDLSTSVRLTERARAAGRKTALYEAAESAYMLVRERTDDVELADEVYKAILEMTRK